MSFDRLAPHYRWLEAVLAGRVLQRCRTAFLAQAQHAQSALILGEGNGRFLLPFLEFNGTVRVVCVEQSGAMIAQTQRLLQRHNIDVKRVQFLQKNVLDWQPPPAAFDLIVSHFFLDCFTEAQLRHLIPSLASAARPGCVWLLADFQVPPQFFQRLRARAIHRLMYAFFRVATDLPATRLTPPDPFLRKAGFRRTERITAQWGLIRSDCWICERQ